LDEIAWMPIVCWTKKKKKDMENVPEFDVDLVLTDILYNMIMGMYTS